MKAANMILNKDTTINLDGQDKIDKVVEEQMIKVISSTVNECIKNKSKRITDKCKAAIERALTEEGEVKRDRRDSQHISNLCSRI